MGKESERRRQARLHKETIRRLETRPLSPAELDQVAGAGVARTWRCNTNCPW